MMQLSCGEGKRCAYLNYNGRRVRKLEDFFEAVPMLDDDKGF